MKFLLKKFIIPLHNWLNMDLESYILESNSEILNNDDNDLLLENNARSNEKEMGSEKGYTTWSEFVEVKSATDQIRSELTPNSDTYTCSDAKDFPVNSGSNQNVASVNSVNPTTSRRGRASVVRLQAVAQSTTTGSTSDFVDAGGQKIISAALDSQDSTHLPAARIVTTSNQSKETPQSFLETQYSSSTEMESALVLTSYPSQVEVSPDSSPEIERFVSSKGRYLYRHKEGFFYTCLPDRENHNEKERQRRSRVSMACHRLRTLVPGLTEKTDKASVFEQTAKYMQFLRKKYGTRYDQAFCEKYMKGKH